MAVGGEYSLSSRACCALTRMDTTRPPMIDLGEELTAVARARLPEVYRQQLAFFFDHEGQRPLVQDAVAARVGRMADHLLGDAIHHADSGTVFFSVQARTSGERRCHLRVQVSDTGPVHAARLESLKQPAAAIDPMLDPSGQVDDIPRVRALCRVLDGSFAFAHLPGEGTMVRADMTLDAVVPDDAGIDADGAEAWLVGHPPVAYESLVRRFQRLGWSIRLMKTVNDARAALWSSHHGSLPALVLGSRMYGVELGELAYLATVLGNEPQVIYATPSGELPGSRVPEGIEVAHPPLSLSTLLRVTRRASASALRPSGQTRPAPLTMASRPRVLVVDDNSLNQLLLCEMLQVLGYEADIESDGRAAVSHCAATPPDGVLMDLQMPVMDGIEATQRIRQLQAERRIPHFPIVAATALTGLHDREVCMRAGMDGYLTKPLDLRSLAVELARHVPAHREQPPDATAMP